MTKKEDLMWQAESDAATLARYEEIVGDKPRMNRALKAAQRQASDLTKQASKLQNVAKRNGGVSATGRKKK